MKVSVIICTYSLERYDAFKDAVESVRSQTYDDVELVLVVDGNTAVYRRAKADFGDHPSITIHCNDDNIGNLQSINVGIELADGDIVANIDDDATAAKDWVENLVRAYEEHDALAAGGRIDPDWVAGEAPYIPEEFYWLIGATYRGFPAGPGEVRNTFGSNLSFRRDVVQELGGYPTQDGERDSRFQAGETELCSRLHEEYGRGVFYVPDAEVYHKIFEYRTDPVWLLKRAFWQGVSKRWMAVKDAESVSNDRNYVTQLVTDFVPDRIKNLVTTPSKTKAAQLAFLIALFGVTGIGYLYGTVRFLIRS